MKHALVFLVVVHAIAFAGQNASNAAYINGRLIVEPAYLPLLAEEITLTFVDLQGRVAVELELREDLKTGSYYVGSPERGGIQGKVVLHTDGTFLVVAPKGEYRILLKRFPNHKATAADKYYVKSITLGSMDLIKETFIVKPADNGELIITLAKCSEDTRQQCT